MSVIVKCKSCNGTGYIPMGNGVRGLLVCKACNGVGKYENDEITIINDEYYYKIPNGTSYVYETIPKEFKPYFDKLQQENKRLKEIIAEVREYLTSYSSIHTIQFGTEEDSPNDIELNKTLDNKTITEMTNRYLMVHDKLLQILDKVKV